MTLEQQIHSPSEQSPANTIKRIRCIVSVADWRVPGEIAGRLVEGHRSALLWLRKSLPIVAQR